MSGMEKASLDDFAAGLVDRALRAGASAAQAQTTATRHLEMQFDNRGVNLARSTENEISSLTVFLDGKRGGATLTGRASDAVEAAIIAALAAAGAGIADDANDVASAESLAPSRHGPDAPDRAAMATGVDAFLDRIAEKHPLVRTRDCLQSFDDVDAAFANSRGLSQRERRARYGFSAMFMAKDGLKTTSINFLGLSAFSPFDDPFRCPAFERLLQETTRSLDKRPVPQKFEGEVIVTPECLSSIVWPIVGALSGPALFAGTTPYKESRNQAIASPLFSLRNLPRDAEAPGGADFDGYGVPTQNLEVIEKGVLKDYLVDYFFSKKLGVPQTSGATRFVVDVGRDAALRDRRQDEARHRLRALLRRQSDEQSRLHRHRQKLLLRRGRRNSVRSRRNHGQRQFPGAVEEHPRRVSGERRFWLGAISVSRGVGRHGVVEVSRVTCDNYRS